MRTVCCSGRLCLPSGWVPAQVSVSAQGVGVCPGGGGCLPKGGTGAVYLGGGVCQTPPVDRMTDRCKNITLSGVYDSYYTGSQLQRVKGNSSLYPCKQSLVYSRTF